MSNASESLLLGIDVGTSSCKVAFFDFRGNLIAQTFESYPTSYSGLRVEQNPEDWWKATEKAIKRLIIEYCIDPERIAGIGVDGQSWAALPIGTDGQALDAAASTCKGKEVFSYGISDINPLMIHKAKDALRSST